VISLQVVDSQHFLNKTGLRLIQKML